MRVLAPTTFPGRACCTLALALLASACANQGTGVPEAITPQRAAAIVADPNRSAADRATDQECRPEAMLVFIGVRPGMIALDVSAGDGYTSELLARAIGPAGEVFGQIPPNEASLFAWRDAGPSLPGEAAMPDRPHCYIPRTPWPSRTSANALTERDLKLRATGTPAAPMFAFVQRFDDPVPPKLADGGLDLVTLIFGYYQLGAGVDRNRMNRALFRALKPGGIYVVADVSVLPGTGFFRSGKPEPGREAVLRQEIQAAGFRLAAEADFVRNPNDLRDRNTLDSPQPRDAFVLKFVKP